MTLGLLLAVDLARANQPWIVYWNYHQKYAANSVTDFLKQAPHLARVQALPFQQLGDNYAMFQQLYGSEWTQHLFLYNNIHCLDITQDPRPAADNTAYKAAFRTPQLLPRLWELTNTRYLFGPSSPAFLTSISAQLDGGRNRFRVHTAFDLAPKAGLKDATRVDEITVLTNANGALAFKEHFLHFFVKREPHAKFTCDAGHTVTHCRATTVRMPYAVFVFEERQNRK